MRQFEKRFNDAEVLWENGQFDEALAMFQEILVDDSIPDMARAIICEYVGRLYVGVGNLSTAEEYLIRSLELDPDGVEHHVQLINCLCLSNRKDEAWGKINDLYEKFPRDPTVIQYMGKFLDERGEHEKGLIFMKKAIRLDPTNVRFLADLAFAYMMRGDAGSAMICSEEAISLNPEDEVAQFIYEVTTEFEKQELEKPGDINSPVELSKLKGLKVKSKRKHGMKRDQEKQKG